MLGDARPTEETKVKDVEAAEEFKRYFPHIRFENVMTSYRYYSTVEFVSKVAEEAKEKGNTVIVLVPQFIPKNIGKYSPQPNEFEIEVRM